MTRSSMSVTSSVSRRPFGNPAVSPASTPKRFGVGFGATPRLIFSVSVGGAFGAIWVSPGMPVSSAWTMSVRSFSGTFSPGNSTLMTLASCGDSDVLAEVLQVVAGLRRVEEVLLPQRDHDLVDQRVAEAADLDLVVLGRLGA